MLWSQTRTTDYHDLVHMAVLESKETKQLWLQGFKHDLLWTSLAHEVLFSPSSVDSKLEEKGGERNLVEIS